MSEKYGISVHEVKKIIESPYEFIKEKTSNLNIPENLNKKDFEKIKTNFNIPNIGKLYASHYVYNEISKKNKKI